MKLKEKKIKTFGIKIVAEENGKEIGGCFIYLIKNRLHEELYALLEDVYVDKNFRGRGIGTELVRKAIELAKNLNCYKIIAISRFGREKIHEWYQNLGFKKFGFEFRMELK